MYSSSYICAAIYNKYLPSTTPFVIVLVVDSQHHLIFLVCYKTKKRDCYTFPLYSYKKSPHLNQMRETKNLTT